MVELEGGYQYLATFSKGEQPDIKWMLDTLGHFFQDDKDGEPLEKLRSANAKFREALKDGGLSPLAAFKKVISTTPLAQEMDARHATVGGLDFYISTQFSPEFPSEALKAEAKAAAHRRKVEEIKKLMASSKEETGGSPAPEAEQVAGGVGQGREGEVEQPEVGKEVEMDGNIKAETQLPVRGVAVSQDVKPEQSG